MEAESRAGSSKISCGLIKWRNSGNEVEMLTASLVVQAALQRFVKRVEEA